MMINQDVEIVFNKRLCPDIFLMKLCSPEIAGMARPGQFVMIRVKNGFDPVLRRPFSICATMENDMILILYRVVGRGTAAMSTYREGERLSVLGPLGTGFEYPKAGEQPVLVSGGIGIAPLIFLAQSIKTGNMKFMAGYASASEIVPIQHMALDDTDIFISTDDGTAGEQGLVTQSLERYLAETSKKTKRVYSCGPLPMLKQVADLTLDEDILCQVSLETTMACGVGACQGCAVSTSSQTNQTYYHVCLDGPVFPAQSLDWEKLCPEK